MSAGPAADLAGAGSSSAGAGRHPAAAAPTPTVLLSHSLPGRTRLRVPALETASAARCEAALILIPGVLVVKANPRTRSVLVRHAVSITPADLCNAARSSLSGILPAGRRGLAANAPEPGRRPGPRPATATRRDGPSHGNTADWHIAATHALAQRLDTSLRDGLDTIQARERLRRFGLNRIEEKPPPGIIEYLARQVTTAPVAMLAGSAVVSVATGGLADAIGIGAAIAANALIGAITEQQSDKTIRLLSVVGDKEARVIRGGRQRHIDSSEIVPGDLLVLSPGDFVPADARILSCDGLSVDESTLTGESMAVIKNPDCACEADTPIAERGNMVFRGTVVIGGSARALVVATAADTEVGWIQQAATAAAAPDTAMQVELNRLGRQLTAASLIACAGVLGLGLLRGGRSLTSLQNAVSLGVAAVPESLPAVATTTLALGVRRMRRNDLLVRNINAVESLGAVQTVCLDKTGTLTENRMAPIAIHVGGETLRVDDGQLVDRHGRPITSAGPELDLLLRLLVLCNDSEPSEQNPRQFKGAPTENALLELAVLAGQEPAEIRSIHPRLETSYRREGRPWMFTLHEAGARGRLLVLKGSPAEVLAMCGQVQRHGRREALTDELREEILQVNAAWADESLRLLGVASDRFVTGEPIRLADLTWHGLVAVADPLRAGMGEMVRRLHAAGIRTVMITGDQAGTAAAIGRQLGLNRRGQLRVLDARDLARLDERLLNALVPKTEVFARVSPANKLQIVRALQSDGQVVAMTGDGVNDGPALKAADVGIAMGEGQTDVARSVADVVVRKNDLGSIISAVSQGRATHANIRKTLRYLVSTNLSEIEYMLVASLIGRGAGLNAIQLLWINLATDALPALALALEPAEAGNMDRPPQGRDEPLIRPDQFLQMLRESGVITAGALGSLAWGLARYGAGESARSMSFNTLIVAQLLHALACRSETQRFGRGSGPNPALFAALGGSTALQLLVMSAAPLRKLLKTGPLAPRDLVVSSLFAAAPILVNEWLRAPSIPGRDRGAQETGNG